MEYPTPPGTKRKPIYRVLFQQKLMRMGDVDLIGLKYLCYNCIEDVEAIYAEEDRREALG